MIVGEKFIHRVEEKRKMCDKLTFMNKYLNIMNIYEFNIDVKNINIDNGLGFFKKLIDVNIRINMQKATASCGGFFFCLMLFYLTIKIIPIFIKLIMQFDF